MAPKGKIGSGLSSFPPPQEYVITWKWELSSPEKCEAPWIQILMGRAGRSNPTSYSPVNTSHKLLGKTVVLELPFFWNQVPGLPCVTTILDKFCRLIWKTQFCGCPILKSFLFCKRSHTYSKENCFKVPHHHTVQPAFMGCVVRPLGPGWSPLDRALWKFPLRLLEPHVPAFWPAPNSGSKGQNTWSEYLLMQRLHLARTALRTVFK